MEQVNQKSWQRQKVGHTERPTKWYALPWYYFVYGLKTLGRIVWGVLQWVTPF